jgi:hypothetical protein
LVHKSALYSDQYTASCKERTNVADESVMLIADNMELMGDTNFVDPLLALCFTASSAVYAWVFVYTLLAVDSSYQLHLPIVLGCN